MTTGSLNLCDQPTPALRRWLAVIQVAWSAFVLLALGLYAVVLPLRFNQLLVITSAAERAPHQLTPASYQALIQTGLSLQMYAAYVVSLEFLVLAGFTLTAFIIFWRRRNDWRLMFFSFALVMISAAAFSPIKILPTIHSGWFIPVKVLEAFGWITMLNFLYLFPDGRFVPRWTLVLGIGWIIWIVTGLLAPNAPFNPSTSHRWGLTWLLVYLAWFATGIYAQIYRYTRVSAPVQRQQTKWVIFGILVTTTCVFAEEMAVVAFPALFPPGAPRLFYTMISTLVYALSMLMVPLTIAISILRYRLFDIDILIQRSLVYSALSLILIGGYALLVTLLQRIFQNLTGGTWDLAVFTATLIIAALFSPLRSGLQAAIDRTFYRRHYDYRLAVLNFGRSLRNIIDIHELLAQLVDWLRETMHISHLAILQARAGQTFAVVKASSAFPIPNATDTLEFAPNELRRLCNGEMIERPSSLGQAQVELAVPMISQNHLVGIMALGPKLSELPYTAEDRALLSTLADQAAAAITIAQLVQENQKKQQLEHEMQLARSIQMGLLPDEPPRLPGMDIAWFCQPARETSGDFYDCVPLGDGAFGLVVADVTGKGLLAAMIATGARAAVRAQAAHYASPAQTLHAANAWLCQDMPEGAFVALLYGCLDSNRRCLTFANAGQLTPLLVRNGGCHYLRSTGARWPLGIFANAAYADRCETLQPGDVLLLYTDGIVEAKNRTGEMYGFERLERALLNAPPTSAQDIKDYILNQVAMFVGDADTHDDMTAIVIKITK